MRNTLITLAELHYMFGLIGRDELMERIHVAFWLSGEIEKSATDPRIDSEEEPPTIEKEDLEHVEKNLVIASVDGANKKPKRNDENWIEFICLKCWVFTKSDPDSYPSIPHGHFKDKDNKWPKLNPYTGRVFRSKHQEDDGRRLTKKEMEIIWSDEKFKSFCREMIICYQEKFPHYEFPVRRPLRMPNW